MTQITNLNETNSTRIPSAARSPRISNKVLKWYVGDTFTIDWSITLTKEGEEYTYAPTDQLAFSFFSSTSTTPIQTFTFSNIPSTNSVTLNFDSTVTAKFPVGEYTYCIKFIETTGSTINTTTIGANNHVEVESCH